VALDCDRQLIQRIGDSPFTPRVGNATSLTDPDDSYEMVLACNVLGDPELGMSDTQSRMAEELKAMYLLDGDLDGYKEILSDIKGAIDGMKDMIVAEAIRVLKPGGRFVVVERYTPGIAVSYITEAVAQERIARLEKVEPLSVLPPSYLAHNNKKPEVWIAERS